MIKLIRNSLPVLFTILLVACSSTAEKDEYANYSPQQMYAAAKQELNGGSYEASIKIYEKLQARFPFGTYAQQAELDVAYAYYKSQEPDMAVASCDRFIKAHPNHPNVDYAYYIKGMANYSGDKSFMSDLYKQDLSDRDPKASSLAFDTFKELVTRFPDSRYAKDASKHMTDIVNALAMHHIHVARYYMKRRAPLAAVNRAKTVLASYQNTTAVEEALFIMAQAYGQLNLPDLQSDTLRVLEKNYPDSTYIAQVKIAKK